MTFLESPFITKWSLDLQMGPWIFKNPLFGETENWRRGVYFDAEYISAPPESPYGAICCLVWQTTQFFSVFQSFGPVGSSFWPNVDDVVKSTSRYGLRWICMNLPPTLVNKSPHVYLAICVWIGSATPVNRVAMHDASFMMPHSGCITLVHCFWCIMNDAWCICMGSIWDHTEINVMKLWSHFGITLWSGFVFHKNRKL